MSPWTKMPLDSRDMSNEGSIDYFMINKEFFA